MSKIVAVVASPRKNGSGSAIVNKMADTLKAAGNDVQVFYINQLENVKGCQACMACKKKGRCIRNDDITTVIDAIRDADGIILSAADYFGQACSQYRMLEDRFYCFFNADFTTNMPAGKKLACVVTCGGGYDGAVKIKDTMESVMTNYYKLEPVGNIVYSEKENGPAKDNQTVLDEAAALAKKF